MCQQKESDVADHRENNYLFNENKYISIKRNCAAENSFLRLEKEGIFCPKNVLNRMVICMKHIWHHICLERSRYREN
jgi:hypothetical protein